MTREDGYYWVKIYSEWQPAEWWSDTENWWLIGVGDPCSESEISKVGEKLVKK